MWKSSIPTARRRGALALGVLAVLGAGFLSLPATLEIAARTRAPVDVSLAADTSPLIVDRNGAWLDASLSRDQMWRFATGIEAVPPLYAELLLAYEDHRFREHTGVSYLAILRAAIDAARHMEVRSGASTLTMQVARLLEGQEPGLRGKWHQAVAARRLAIDHSRDEILEFYLTLTPFGGNVEGVEAAAVVYFGKRASELSQAETALLVAIPQAPEKRRLDRGQLAGETARRRVLARGVHLGVLSRELAGELAATHIRAIERRPFGSLLTLTPDLGPVDGPGNVRRTTIDADLQKLVRADLQRGLATLPFEVTAAALVVRNRDGAVLAAVGNARDLEGPAGYLDLTRAKRSPGSALKPFVYGLAFERNLAHPYTLFYDRHARYGAFSPENFGEGYEPGPITLRDALAKSLNTAAVAVMNEVGADDLLARLRSAGAELQLPRDAGGDPGLAVTLGGVGISLRDLAGLYVALANGGVPRALHLHEGAAADEGTAVPLLSPGAVWAVTDALTGVAPPEGSLPLRAGNGDLRVAYKTGTSSGRRDTWAVGFDRDHTVAIWVGRPDSGGIPQSSGQQTAAPILWSIFQALPQPAAGVMMDDVPADAGHLGWTTPPARLRHIGAARPPVQIQFPIDSGVVVASHGKVTIAVSGGSPPYHWFVNSRYVASGRSQTLSLPMSSGPLNVTVRDGRETSDTVNSWIQ